MRLNILPSSEKAERYLSTVERAYKLRFLTHLRESTGSLTRAERSELTALKELFQGDLGAGRRSSRRYRVQLPATVVGFGVACHGMITNFSWEGICLAVAVPIQEGWTLQVKIGRPEELEYTFTCLVRRVYPSASGSPLLGCSVIGLPFRRLGTVN